MISFKTYKSRDEWLEARKNTIGGSDAASVVGLNPWKSNVELWEHLTGKTTPEDISDKPVVRYGIEAEAPLRELFKLDYPEYFVDYVENNMFINPEYPFGHYSADGWLLDKSGRWGLWECKTATIQSASQRDKWENKVPDNYFCQIIHGFLITEAEFAVLKAQLKNDFTGVTQTKHYFFERNDYLEDIERLKIAERDFYEHVKNDTRPARLLPNL